MRDAGFFCKGEDPGEQALALQGGSAVNSSFPLLSPGAKRNPKLTSADTQQQASRASIPAVALPPLHAPPGLIIFSGPDPTRIYTGVEPSTAGITPRAANEAHDPELQQAAPFLQATAAL